MAWLKWLVRGGVLLAALAAAGAAWLLGTESGLRWALGFVPPGIELQGARGALAGTIFFERVAFQGSEARNLSLDPNLLALAADTISISFIRAESVRLRRPEGPAGGSAVLPFRVRIGELEVKSLVFEGYEIHDLRAEYSGSASGHDAQAWFGAAGARARLKASVRQTITIDAEVQELNLAAIDPALPQTALQIRLAGQGTADSFAGTVSAVNPEAGPLDRERLPFGRIGAAFVTDLKKIELQQIRAALHPRGTIEGKGNATLERASLDIRVAELDLRGLVSSLVATRLAGPLALEVEPGRQHVRGSLAQADMSLAAEAERRGDDVEIRTLRARAGDSEATGSGRIRLQAPLKFVADLRLARFDPSRFGDYPKGSINGSVKGNGDLGGRGSAAWEVADSTLLGQKLASRGTAQLSGERILAADAWLTLGANRASVKGAFGAPQDRLAWTLHVPDLAALAADMAGEIHAQGSASGTWKAPASTLQARASGLRLAPALIFDQASVAASGTLERHEGQVAARGSDLDFKASLRGGWSNRAWRGQITALKNAGAYPLALKTPAALEAGPQRVALGRFEAELAGAHAAVESVRWESDRLTSSGSLTGLPAQWILGALKVDKLAGDLMLAGEWQLASTPKLNGTLALRRASGDLSLGDTPIGLERAVLDASFRDDRVTAKADIASRLGTASMQGTAAALAPDATLALTAEVEATELRALTEPLLTQARFSGRVGATLRVAGTLAKPVLSGTLRGDALGVEMPPWGIALHDGRLRAELDANRLRVTEARIAAGEGSFSATGTLPLAFAEGGATLEWQAQRIRILHRPDRRLVVSGGGTTTFDGKRLGLVGELRADSGHFEIADDSLPQLASDVEIVGRAPTAAEKRATLPLNLDLKVDLGNRLTLRAYGYNGSVTGQVRLTTDAAGALQAHGRVQALNARYSAYGQELEVDPGMLVFGGPLDNPGLDISAWRRHQQVEAGLRLTGTVQVPHVELISNPPVSESERLSWLVLGRAPAEAKGADLAVLQAASGAVFGRGNQPTMSRRFASKFGFDELTVRGSSELASNVVALGKRYSDKVYVSFEQAIGATTEYLVKVDYALTQRVSLRGQTGTTSGGGLFYRYSWD